jgi:flagellar basal body-associated protein FliL
VLLLGTPKDLQQEVNSAIDSKKEPLKNMLITYFSGHTLDEVSGDKNVTRIQREIAEEFNRRLWADGKPRIQEVLFKEWAIH